jgi:hypothetical protein
MMTLIAAAALAAQTSAAPAPVNAQPQHENQMQMGQSGEHKDMNCCKKCCKDMAAKHEGHGTQHSEHTSH